MEGQIKKELRRLGSDLCGIAHVDLFADAPKGFHPADIYKDCRSVVVFALPLPIGLSWVSPRIIYYRSNNVVLAELDRIALAASRFIEALGGTAVPIPSDSPYEFWNSEKLEGRGLLSMRHAAELAGIGSLGKNTLLISSKYGNMLNLCAILTNLELKSDPPSEKFCIPGCRICLDSCPSGALNGVTVNQKLCREYTYTTNDRGFDVCNCNTCRISCPRAFGTDKHKKLSFGGIGEDYL